MTRRCRVAAVISRHIITGLRLKKEKYQDKFHVELVDVLVPEDISGWQTRKTVCHVEFDDVRDVGTSGGS